MQHLYGAENEDRGCACVTVNNEDHLNVIDHDSALLCMHVAAVISSIMHATVIH